MARHPRPRSVRTRAGDGRRRPAMRPYLVRQLVQLAVVIVGISILAFAILHVIGDPLLAPAAAERRQGGVRAPPEAARARPAHPRPVLEVRQPGGPGRLRQVVVRGHSRLPLVLERMPPTLYLTLRRPRGGAADRAAPRHPGRAQAALRRGQPVHDDGGGRAGDADLLARHHAHHRLRRAPAGAARLGVRDLAALPHACLLPGRLPRPDHHAAGALRRHRGHEHGVHQDRAGQGRGARAWSWSSTRSATPASPCSPCSGSSSVSSSAGPSSPRPSSRGPAWPP